jgi:hypothetical protein
LVVEAPFSQFRTACLQAPTLDDRRIPRSRALVCPVFVVSFTTSSIVTWVPKFYTKHLHRRTKPYNVRAAASPCRRRLRRCRQRAQQLHPWRSRTLAKEAGLSRASRAARSSHAGRPTGDRRFTPPLHARVACVPHARYGGLAGTAARSRRGTTTMTAMTTMMNKRGRQPGRRPRRPGAAVADAPDWRRDGSGASIRVVGWYDEAVRTGEAGRPPADATKAPSTAWCRTHP